MRRFQFRLRTLMLLTLLASLLLSWCAVQAEKARREREAFWAVVNLGGQCYSNYENPSLRQPRDNFDVGQGLQPPPAWLCAEERLLGSDVLGWRHVTGVSVDWDNLLGQRACCDFTAQGCRALCRRLANCPQLCSLCLKPALSSTPGPVTDECLEFLEAGPPLRQLWVCSRQLSDAGLGHLERLHELEDLDLDGCQVTDAGLRHLRGLTHLRRLNLAKTRVSGTGLEWLRGRMALTSLQLQGAPVSDAGLQAVAGLPGLARLPHLRLLDLRGTTVSEAALEKLRRTRPGCEILTGENAEGTWQWDQDYNH